jgi:hypothetical protein
MITMNKAALVLALGSALSLGASNAMACTFSAWNGGATGAPVAASPTGTSDASPKRVAALCGLQTQSGVQSFVTDNSPGTEGTYRARFYVFTGTATTAGTVFSATSADAGGGTEVIAVDLNPATDQFTFFVNGTNVGTAPAVDRKWYGIEVAYVSGTSFSATSKTSDTTNIRASITTTVTNNTPGTGTVASARLGNIDGLTAAPAAINVDEFDSSRGTTAIGYLCRGDANNSGGITATDRFAITQELALPPVFAPGQPDCNEDGRVTATDRFCVTEKLNIIGNPTLQCN